MNVSQFQNIIACDCDEDGSRDVSCDDDTGKCSCKASIIGDKCNFCTQGYYGFPHCTGIFFWN